jgi:hypothetical protein
MSEHEKRGTAMNIGQAVATAAAAGDVKLRCAYAAVVSRGASNTSCTAEQEREYGTLRLLTLAWLRLPDLVLYAHLLEGFADDPEVDTCEGATTRRWSPAWRRLADKLQP